MFHFSKWSGVNRIYVIVIVVNREKFIKKWKSCPFWKDSTILILDDLKNRIDGGI